MAQRQKHWIQAMLHEDPYIPVTTSYDVTAWSNPLLMNLDGGSSGDATLAPSGKLVPTLAAPAPPVLPQKPPGIGLFEMPGSTAFASAGSIRYLFERVWNVPYQKVDADMIAAGLSGIDVLLVPDGYVNDALQALGTQGRKALAKWVANGGRYVGYVGGTELAARTGVSTVVLQNSRTTAPGTLIRIRLEDPTSPLAAGIGRTVFPYANPIPGPTAWIMYDDNDLMSPGLGAVVASFPPKTDPAFFTSGLAQNVDELAGSAAIVDERVGAGRAILFSFDPNFRAWSDGTQRLLWNALFGPSPVAGAAIASAATRTDALDRADRSARNLAGLGKAIRIVVRDVDADATRAVLQRYGAEFKELRRPDQTIFLVENRRGLSWEEHPFILQLHRELLTTVQPISFSVP
jgi:hypothetical protein